MAQIKMIAVGDDGKKPFGGPAHRRGAGFVDSVVPGRSVQKSLVKSLVFWRTGTTGSLYWIEDGYVGERERFEGGEKDRKHGVSQVPQAVAPCSSPDTTNSWCPPDITHVERPECCHLIPLRGD